MSDGMCFNRTQLLATGDALGCVMIWKLSDELTKQTLKEEEQLEDIAKSALE